MLFNEKKKTLYMIVFTLTPINKRLMEEGYTTPVSTLTGKTIHLRSSCILNPLTQFCPESESADYLIRIERIFLILLFDLSLK